VRKATSILSKSLAELAAHKEEDFIPYGDYRFFEAKVAQLKREFKSKYFEPRPHLVALYGPPGTGKTTWVRHVAKKFLFENGVLRGIYLEASPGDFQSKWAGVPINTAKAFMECIKVRHTMSIALLDEADGLLVKPERADCGVTVEQMQLVSELKSQLSFVASQSYPTMIVLTTNYKDSIVRAEPALADRVTAWVYVGPPPPDVRVSMIAKLVARLFRDVWLTLDPLGQVTILRVLMMGGVAPTIVKWGGFDFSWRLPVLPFEADYLVAYLSAWGWSPLAPDVLDAYGVDLVQALQLWRDDNPVARVYAKGLTTLVELARVAALDFHGMERSFLRLLNLFKRGFEDLKRLYADVYIEGYEDAVYAYLASGRKDWPEVRQYIETLKELGMQVPEDDPEKAASWARWEYGEDLRETLFTHPVPPVLMHQVAAKYFEVPGFHQIVNDVHSMIYFITAGLRYAFLPLVYTATTDMYTMAAEFRRKVEIYSRFIKRELLEGELLKPLRIMYEESDAEKAWAEAVKALSEVEDEEIRSGVALALTPLKLLHPAIHAKDTEEKAQHLYEAFKDRDVAKEALWSIAKELNIHLDIYPVFDIFPVPGMYVWPDKVVVKEASMLHPYIFDYYKRNAYHPANTLEDLRAVAVSIKRKSKELVEKLGLRLD